MRKIYFDGNVLVKGNVKLRTRKDLTIYSEKPKVLIVLMVSLKLMKILVLFLLIFMLKEVLHAMKMFY